MNRIVAASIVLGFFAVSPSMAQTVGSNESASTETPREFLAAGSRTAQFWGSGTIGDSDLGHVYTAHAGMGWFLFDNFSVNVDLLGGYADATEDDNGVVAGFDLLFRWHFLRGDRNRWTVYIDGGAGFQLASTNFPSDSHHNFRPQAGLGATWQITPSAHLLGGARFMHISNASTSEENDGLDIVQAYAGVMFPF